MFTRQVEAARQVLLNVAFDAPITVSDAELADTLGARVAIQSGRGGRGKLVVSYNSLDELDGILAHIQ